MLVATTVTQGNTNIGDCEPIRSNWLFGSSHSEVVFGFHGDAYVQAPVTAHRVTDRSRRGKFALFVENYQVLLQIRKELAEIQEMTENLMN